MKHFTARTNQVREVCRAGGSPMASEPREVQFSLPPSCKDESEKTSSQPPTSLIAKTFIYRKAVEEDLPHIEVLSGAAGGKIVPGGGDFVVKAWPSWWTQHPKLHFNQWCFDGDLPAGFVRIECYGQPDCPESGWLEGLRVNPTYQGQGVMTKVVTECLKQVPGALPMLLAVGSENTQMVPIADAKYDFVGGMVLHRLNREAALDPAVAAAAAKADLSARVLRADDLDEVWSLLSQAWALPTRLLPTASLLLPGRFYAFREPTRGALADKITHSRALGAFSDIGLVGVFIAFDSDLEQPEDGETVVISFHTAVLAPGLDTAMAAAALHAIGTHLPTVHPTSGRPQRNVLSAGPFLPPGDTSVEAFYVDEPARQLLAAACFERLRPSHLRLYRLPRQPRQPSCEPADDDRRSVVRAALLVSAIGVLSLAVIALRRRISS